MYIPHLFIHSSLKGHFGCFYYLPIMNNPAMNTGVQVCISVSAFNSFGYIPRNEIAGAYDNSIFNFLKNWEQGFSVKNMKREKLRMNPLVLKWN